ncbi:hypothetical protein K503DRAFT_794391 [Rhizopogon vinicolor AM-OR11-026]|uniref:CxC2-like cysteine cluster KDZ transposase-associated domain-containing protein n=1 Tax=Rhizopogon vinicolor AM-OR11-026 TaxID=1314800 RepID=A0A1B7MMJ8_9AGAM|nr:hypothetical protein K503DRAFT_794391 [Rhizopogon vinicolor AM-OR11-026]
MDDRNLFLLEFLWHEGRGDHAGANVCWNCRQGVPQFRCMDCFGSELYCQDCIVVLHAQNPVHRIQDLGLCVQLRHPAGEYCLLPERAFDDDFTLIHTNGIQTIGLDFCGCETAQTRTKQLLRVAWFPATTIDPRTAATFRILEQYHLLSFESKASGYEFYHSIARLTDNTGLLPGKDRYEAFIRMIREWRHLKMLKRAGRGHDPGGIENTRSGECAVLCPACPQPDKNLPHDWRAAPKTKGWIYGLFLAIDTNFRLKRRNMSKDSNDPGLSRGWAYFVDETTYKGYLQAHSGKLQERSTCSSHNAVNMADTKASQGLAATGVGTIDCARHNMKLPNGVGDLQKGERYANMDFLFFSTLHECCIDTLNVSYDIACQWHKNLWQRMSTMPPALHIDRFSKFIRFFVPKFHLPVHILKCQTTFSFNFSKNVGCTDGEAPERGWSNINPVASSTKEMGPGSRRDTLDDHFGDWNWKKVVGLGAMLLRKMDEAKEEDEAHRTVFEELDGALKRETSEPWKLEVEHWEYNPNDSSVTNPFEAKVTPITQAAVRLKFMEMEAHDLQQGIDISLHPDISPSVFIASGIDLENEQHVQALYTPTVQLLNSRSESSSQAVEITPEDAKLFLPSTMQTESMPCNMRLETIEDWVCGQSTNTRARNSLSRVEAKASTAAEKYRAAHLALSSLAPVLGKVGWNVKYKVLDKKDDVRGMSVPKNGESEGRRQLSWIWLVEGVGDDQDEVVQDSLRVEWCKARARSMRWAEEVELLNEEMRRVLQFLRWHASWWNELGRARTLSTAADNEGLVAYARCQAQLRHDLADHFQTIDILQ